MRHIQIYLYTYSNERPLQLVFITIQMFIPFLISVALPPLQENDLKSTYYTLYHHQWCDKKVFLFLESQNKIYALSCFSSFVIGIKTTGRSFRRRQSTFI